MTTSSESHAERQFSASQRVQYEREFEETLPSFVDTFFASRAVRSGVALQDAKDVLQEVLAGMWLQWSTVRKYSPKGRTAYLYGVIHRQVARYVRRRQRERREMPTLTGEVGSPFERAVQQSLEEQLEKRDPKLWNPQLWSSIARLTPKQRAALLLHYLEDMSVAEVASYLNCTSGTIKTHLSRARDAMRAALELERVD